MAHKDAHQMCLQSRCSVEFLIDFFPSTKLTLALLLSREILAPIVAQSTLILHFIRCL